jgi:hypothetical protein
VPVVIFFSGAAGYCLWLLLRMLQKKIIPWIIRSVRHRNMTQPVFWGAVACVLGLVAGVFLAGQKVYATVIRRVSIAKEVVEYVRGRQDYAFDHQQADFLLSRIQPHESVVYIADIPMHLYFASGFYRYGAVFYPVLYDPTLREKYIYQNENARYLVAYSPLKNLPQGRIPLSPARVVIRFDNPQPELSLFFDCMTDATSGSLDMLVETSQGSVTISYLLDEVANTKIHPESVALTGVSSLTLSVRDANKSVYITGIQMEPNSHLAWPWNAGMQLEYYPNLPEGEPKIIQFTSRELFSRSRSPLRILADKGITILAEFIH